MNRTRSIVWTIAVLIAIAVTTVFLLRPTDQRVEAAPNLPTAPSAALALTPERAAELGAQVRSADPVQVRQALALPEDQKLDPALIPALASLKGLTIDPATFKLLGDKVGQATAHVQQQGKAPTTWTLDLLLVDDSWKIAATRPVAGRP